LARLRGLNEPVASEQKAQALSHLVREAKAFESDFGHQFGREWDEKINGFRLGLENILGNRPGSLAITPTGKARADKIADPEQGLSVVTGHG